MEKAVQDKVDLSGANLHSLNLSGANLARAMLVHANLTLADLADANLAGANLSCANLRRACLARANLTGANLIEATLLDCNLVGTVLDHANLHKTCLDPKLRTLLRRFTKSCPPLKTGGRIVYRTLFSQFSGNLIYEPGHTYIAPHLSFSSETECHPGIYAGPYLWIRQQYKGEKLVRCYVRDGDWVITCKGHIRCARLRVLSEVR